jgi:hypothetical protein
MMSEGILVTEYWHRGNESQKWVRLEDYIKGTHELQMKLTAALERIDYLDERYASQVQSLMDEIAKLNKINNTLRHQLMTEVGLKVVDTNNRINDTNTHFRIK